MSQIANLAPVGSAPAGDVVGPGSSTDHALVRWDGATGLLIQNSAVILDDSDNMTGVTSLTIDGSSGNTLVVNSTDFVVDSDTNRVGVGTASPSTTFHVVGAEGMTFDGIAAGYAGSEYLTLQAAVQTTDATETTLASVLCNAEEMVTIHAMVNGFVSDFDEAVAANVFASARRDTAGNITLIGTPLVQVVEDAPGEPTILVDADTGTQTIRIRVIGEASTYNWTTTYHYMKTLTDS